MITQLIAVLGLFFKLITVEQLRLTVTIDDYLDKLVEYCIMKLYCIATVKETRQTWADEDDFQVLKPSIDVKVYSRDGSLKSRIL